MVGAALRKIGGLLPRGEDIKHFALKQSLQRLPTRTLQRTLESLIKERSAALPPAEGLRFLFSLEAAIYPLEGELAVRYGGGVHTKVHHTNYHGFFVSRIRPGERVLDVGCGPGLIAVRIAREAGAKVTAVDWSERNLALARRRSAHPLVEYHLLDVTKIRETLPEASFDVLVLSNILEHLKDRAAFLGKLMKDTGASRCLIRVPLFERDWRVPLKRELGVEWRLDATHETEYTDEAFAEEIREAGLRVEERIIRWGEIWAVCTT